jgi:hypothetical protein
MELCHWFTEVYDETEWPQPFNFAGADRRQDFGGSNLELCCSNGKSSNL